MASTPARFQFRDQRIDRAGFVAKFEAGNADRRNEARGAFKVRPMKATGMPSKLRIS